MIRREAMTYQEAKDYLYNQTPLFQNIGAGAYKEGLENTLALDCHFGHPHTKYRTIHIAGTNGKGSCAHTLAAVLQSAGYKTGLYTSPHLVDFSERIRVNGKPISPEYVVNFVTHEKNFFEPLHPSFFEVVTAMAFKYFAEQNVDVAVIEVGMGGRLDCTNIISPDISIITNISFDHMQFLGNTLSKIAYEKAGIIKRNTPVVVGESLAETKPVFENKAHELDAEIDFADEDDWIDKFSLSTSGCEIKSNHISLPLHYELGGEYQWKNANTILHAIARLRTLGYSIDDDSVCAGFSHVVELTGLRARWEKLSSNPTIIIDTGHNPAGLAINLHQLTSMKAGRIMIVLGMVSDKDVESSLALMPADAVYYFTQASVKRALDSGKLYEKARKHGLSGRAFPDVPAAFMAALQDSSEDDVIYVGGSNFVVGDLLRFIDGRPVKSLLNK